MKQMSTCFLCVFLLALTTAAFGTTAGTDPGRAGFELGNGTTNATVEFKTERNLRVRDFIPDPLEIPKDCVRIKIKDYDACKTVSSRNGVHEFLVKIYKDPLDTLIIIFKAQQKVSENFALETIQKWLEKDDEDPTT